MKAAQARNLFASSLSWQRVKGFSSSPCGLSVGLFITRQPAVPRVSDQDGSCSVFYSPMAEMKDHHFCHIPVVTQTNLIPYMQGVGAHWGPYWRSFLKKKKLLYFIGVKHT